MKVDLRNGDCVEVMKALPDASVDAVVTDPPYELGFMGKRWDASGIAYSVSLWTEALRVLKPGGHLLAFGGTRTYHRMACAIEDAGFEIRDSIHWIYGSGFPKSLDVSKAIDKAAGIWRGRAGAPVSENGSMSSKNYERTDKGEPTTAAAKQWDGWGTALKPAHEPVVVARKPLVGTVTNNVQQHGTGALNIDGCRVAHNEECRMMAPSQANIDRPSEKCQQAGWRTATLELKPEGRWPPNILLSHTPECGEACAEDCAVAQMDRQSGTLKSGVPGVRRKAHKTTSMSGRLNVTGEQETGYGDSGGASRFFPVFRYQAKASRSERGIDNKHPTVKPVALMRWLVRLVTPPGGVVLEPFMGSGTTGVACVQEGFGFIGIEREGEYFEICKARIAAAQAESPTQKELF